MRFQGTVVYEIDDTCYYVTSLNDRTVQKFEGADRDRVIKQLAYESGPKGAEVTSPEGSGRTAVLTEPEGDETGEIPEELSVGVATADDSL